MQEDIKLIRQLLLEGHTPDELARLTRSGTLVRVRRGAYAEPLPGDPDRVREHVRLVRATVGQCSPEAVVSHMSAAAVHALPVWTDRLDKVQLTRDQEGGGKRRRYVEVRGIRLPERDVQLVAGLRTTTLSRTALDLACLLPMRQAVAVGDASLRRGVTAAALDEQLAAARGRAGVVRARRAVAFLDPRSESPGESVSRVDLAALGVSPEELQYVVEDQSGQFVARTDFAWPSVRTLGEYDGRGKYGELRRSDQTPEDVLWDEKQREDRLRDLGWQVVRWTWEQLRRPDQLLARLRRAFARGAAYS